VRYARLLRTRRPQAEPEPSIERLQTVHADGLPMRECARQSVAQRKRRFRLAGETRGRVDEPARGPVEPLRPR